MSSEEKPRTEVPTKPETNNPSGPKASPPTTESATPKKVETAEKQPTKKVVNKKISRKQPTKKAENKTASEEPATHNEQTLASTTESIKPKAAGSTTPVKKKPPKGKAPFTCGCFGTRHAALANCLFCGRIACKNEGYNFCPFCGYLIEPRDMRVKPEKYVTNVFFKDASFQASTRAENPRAPQHLLTLVVSTLHCFKTAFRNQPGNSRNASCFAIESRRNA